MKTMICYACWGTLKEPKSLFNKKCTYCLDGVIKDVQLSTNFLLSEMLHSNHAVRNKVPNIPDQKVIENLKDTCIFLLEPIRTKFGPLVINSGYRSVALNKAIGGSKTSAHVEGNAADILPLDKKVKLKDMMIWMIQNRKMLNYDQIIYESTWIHVGFKKEGYKKRGDELMMFGSKYFPFDIDDPRII